MIYAPQQMTVVDTKFDFLLRNIFEFFLFVLSMHWNETELPQLTLKTLK